MSARPAVVDHVAFLVDDLAASAALFTPALAALGLTARRAPDGVHYGAEGAEAFALFTGSPATAGAHVSFTAPDRDSVDAFFEQAIAHGAVSRGRPGRWDQYSDRYYAAYVDDLHGNNIEAVWHAPAPVRQAPRRVLASVLSTDIVGSTEHLARVGDREWTAVLGRHHAAVRAALRDHGGREIDNAGDGFLACFEQPGAAIRAALAITAAVRDLGLEVRAGIHTGECELVDGRLTGIAVHIAARVSSLATAGEVLVSQTVKDLVAGSELRLDGGGEHELKGVPGVWRVYCAALG